MRLRTELEPAPLRQRLSCRDGIFILGSCFADNIGTWLKESYLNVCSNPFGVLYNPASIASSIGRMLKPGSSSEFTAVQSPDGLYYSFMHHGSFSGKTPEELLNQLNTAEQDASSAFARSQHIIVTFGTAWVYEREGAIVANCHKFPAKTFTRRRLSVEEIVGMWRPLIQSTDKHFIFTVSPIRHIKDTLHGNQISKSTLLLAIDTLCAQFPDRVEYLPIYELLIDDLRDYRFYADDLVHPSSVAIEIVKDYFAENCLDKECQKYLKEVEPLVKAKKHRPLNPESDAYQSFVKDTQEKLESLKSSYRL